jgi:hypothetical protein
MTKQRAQGAGIAFADSLDEFLVVALSTRAFHGGRLGARDKRQHSRSATCKRRIPRPRIGIA